MKLAGITLIFSLGVIGSLMLSTNLLDPALLLFGIGVIFHAGYVWSKVLRVEKDVAGLEEKLEKLEPLLNSIPLLVSEMTLIKEDLRDFLREFYKKEGGGNGRD